ncbi:hypothetical protein U1Q18_027600 [Sarracenia purpurea var. burkii]
MVSDRKHCSKQVCVIGAGPSGLVTARELREEGHSVVVFEQSHDVGGQWLYDPNVEDEDPLGKAAAVKVHSSVYASLRLNSPREIMGFTDFPFLAKKGRDMRRFPGHKELFLYLKDFCDWFCLEEMIRFNTRVEYVGMLEFPGFGNKDLKWVVRSREKKCEKLVVEEVFDAVVVATGHYSQPRLPAIRGRDTWKRKQMHSHIYRVPEPFRDEVVVVVGNSLSGQDISMELVDVAKEIHLSAKSLDVSEGLSKVISKHQNLFLRPQGRRHPNRVEGTYSRSVTVGSLKVDPNVTGVHFSISSTKPISDALSLEGEEADSEEYSAEDEDNEKGKTEDGDDTVSLGSCFSEMKSEASGCKSPEDIDISIDIEHFNKDRTSTHEAERGISPASPSDKLFVASMQSEINGPCSSSSRTQNSVVHLLQIDSNSSSVLQVEGCPYRSIRQVDNGYSSKSQGTTETKTQIPNGLTSWFPLATVPISGEISGEINGRGCRTYAILYLTCLKGDWEIVEEFLYSNVEALRTSITRGSETALHIDAGLRHTRFVKELVKLMRPEDLAL